MPDTVLRVLQPHVLHGVNPDTGPKEHCGLHKLASKPEKSPSD